MYIYPMPHDYHRPTLVYRLMKTHFDVASSHIYDYWNNKAYNRSLERDRILQKGAHTGNISNIHDFASKAKLAMREMQSADYSGRKPSCPIEGNAMLDITRFVRHGRALVLIWNDGIDRGIKL